MEIIIEEISKGRKLLGRHKFNKSTVNIGRGYDSDVILSDPHICAEHLSIEYNGEHWVVIDTKSINGSFLGDGKNSANEHIIASGDIITLGKSQVRVVFPNHPVAETITLSPFENLINLTKHPVALFLNITFFAALTAWISFLNSPTEINYTQLLVQAIGAALLFSIWPAAVSLVSHLTKHEARFLTQLGVCFVFYNIIWANDFIETFIRFNTSSYFPLAKLLIIVPIIITFCIAWMNCYIGFHMGSVRRIVVSISLTTLLFGGTYLVQLSKKPDFSIRPQFDATLLSPAFLIAPSSSVNEFIDSADKLFNKVNEAKKDEKE